MGKKWLVGLVIIMTGMMGVAAALETVVYRDVSNGQGTGCGTTPSVAIDTINSKILIATKNNDQFEKPWLFICNPDGSDCTDHDVSSGQGSDSGNDPSAAIDTANSKVIIATRNDAQDSKLWLFICNLDGSGCANHDASGGQGPNSGITPSLAIDTINAKVLIATRNVGNDNKPWLYICNLDGSSCSDHDVSAGQGSRSGNDPSLAIDTANSKVLIATRNDREPWLFICNLDGSGCTNHDISAGQVGNSGLTPSLAIDTVNSKALVATRHGPQGSRPWLFICNLDGSGCSAHNASATQGENSGHNPSLAIDTANAKAVIATRNNGQGFKPWLFVCNLDGTGCTDLDASGGQVYTLSATPSLLVSPPLAFLATPVTSNNALGLNIISPSVPLGCPPSIPNGNLTLVFNYPNWEFVIDASTCFPGYAPVGGATTGFCAPAATSWSTTLPSCVFNASSLVVAFDSLTAKANEDLPFTLTDAGGRPGSDPGTSTLAVLLDGEAVDSLAFSYLDGEFDAEFQVPERVGVYTYSIFLGGLLVSSADIQVVPNVFDGFVTSLSMSNTTGVLTAPLERPTLLRLTIQDAFGNGLVVDDDGSREGIKNLFEVRLESGESTTPLAPTPVVRVGDDSHVDALYTVRPLILGDSTLRVIFTGGALPASVPCLCGGATDKLSPFPVQVVCPLGLEETGATCVAAPCNENSVNVAPAGVDVPECVCDVGFTFARLDNNSIPVCDSCPEGGVCERGLGAPVAAPGFYPVPDGTFVRCKRKTACRGGTNPCARGYEGYMCNTCEDGYYSNSAGNCAACPGAAGGIFAGALILLVAMGVGLAVLVAVGVASATKSARDSASFRVRKLPASPSMVLIVLQVIGLFASANFGWSDSAQRTLNVFNVANVDVNLFASECALDSFHTKYAISIGLPLLLILLTLLTLVVFKAANVFGLGEVGLLSLVDSMTFTVAPLVYIPVAKATFVIFDCTRLPNGDFVLDVDPGVACFDGAWWNVSWIGMVSVAGFVIGVPVYFFVCVYRRQNQLMDPVTFARYGALYRLYRIPYFWGGVADLAKRLSIVLVAVFVSEHVLTQLALLLAVFLASIVAVTKLQPFYYPLYNDLEFRLTLILIVLLLLGVGSYAERNTEGSTDTAFLVGIILTLAAFAAVSVHAVVTDMYQIYQARKSQYSAVDDRIRRIVESLEREALDLDEERAGRANTFLSTFAAPAGSSARACTTRHDTIALQDMNAVDHSSEA